MERSLDSIVEEIAQNDEMSREFAAMDEMDEIYRYCKDAGLDCSEEEFDDEVSALIDDFENSEYQLSHVAGGTKPDNANKKWENIRNSMGLSEKGRTMGQWLLNGRR